MSAEMGNVPQIQPAPMSTFPDGVTPVILSLAMLQRLNSGQMVRFDVPGGASYVLVVQG